MKMNYTVLKTQYSQLEINYTTLQAQYNQLQSQYRQLQSEYSSLMANYTGIINTLSSFKSMAKPTLYYFQSGEVGSFILFLNITNPTSEPMNLTMEVYVGPPLSTDLITLSAIIYAPPNTTLALPLMLALYNSSALEFTGFEWSGGFSGFYSLSMFTRMNLTITILTNKLTNLGLAGVTYNTSIVTALPVNKPFGYAIAYPSSSGMTIYLDNPLPNPIVINSYTVYAYNNTVLVSCKVGTSPTINSTTLTEGLDLPTQSINYSYFSTLVITPNGPVEQTISLGAISCSNNFVFPSSIAQMPYGYVVLNTNIGNITIPLLPGYGWWFS